MARVTYIIIVLYKKNYKEKNHSVKPYINNILYCTFERDQQHQSQDVVINMGCYYVNLVSFQRILRTVLKKSRYCLTLCNHPFIVCNSFYYMEISISLVHQNVAIIIWPLNIILFHIIVFFKDRSVQLEKLRLFWIVCNVFFLLFSFCFRHTFLYCENNASGKNI